MKTVLILGFLLAAAPVGWAATAVAPRPVVVSTSGKGDFRTVQEAINSLPAHAAQSRTILIKNGTYREKIYIDGKDNLVLQGESEKGVVLSTAQARDAWHCTNPDDWGVATLNVRNAPDLTLENLTVLNTYGSDHKGQPDELLPCPNGEATAPKKIGANGHQMAMRTFAGSPRIMVKHCTFRALGGDTVSPWDTENGLFYFKDCTLEGGVDFYCPRGWAYAENCRFECHSTSAAIWHDGSGNQNSKTVLKNCTFTGDDNFKLGRFHREAQFYLVGCKFPKNMADADIYQAQSGPGAKNWGRRVYYFGCHREGGDYAWMRDNLTASAGAPRPEQITANWAFGGRWNVDKNRPALPAPAAVAVQTDSIAEKMLVFQRSVGGWPKAVGSAKVDYSHRLTAADRTKTLADKNRNDATIDNNATSREINYLVEAYQKTNNPAYRAAAEAGVGFLLKMQYANGGFPQYYPDFSNYRHQITYNDNAMVRVLVVLRKVANQTGPFAALDASYAKRAKDAVDRGIDCILKTQYRRQGQLTAWCAQYDEKTLLPVKARAFELASLSGDESVEIVRFLMGIENPSAEVKTAIESAVSWFEKVKLKDTTMKEIAAPGEKSGRDRVIVPEAGATLWARFYELDTDRPIYVGRDSQVHYQLTEIENERRAGYLYAGTWPEKLLTKEYPAWQKRVSTGEKK